MLNKFLIKPVNRKERKEKNAISLCSLRSFAAIKSYDSILFYATSS